jgi:curved DNA-binding protein CbpA
MSDDQRAAKEILAARDYYAVLGVARNASLEDIRRAFKKKALLVHPDKSKHPQADAAFKAVNTAYSTLADASLRAAYDRGGTEAVRAQESGGGGGAPRGGGGFGGGGGHYQRYDANDIFDELFGNLFGMPRNPHARHRAQQQQQQQQYARQQQYQQQQQQHARQQQRHAQEGPELGFGVFMAIPFLLFIAMSFILSMGSGSSSVSSRGGGVDGWGRRPSFDGLYSLVRNQRNGYTIRRQVSMLHEIPDISLEYFVRGNFEDLLRRNGIPVRSVEIQVAKDQRESLGRRCKAEMESRSTAALRRRDRPTSCVDYDKLRYIPTV